MKSIETHARAFLPLNISAIGSVSEHFHYFLLFHVFYGRHLSEKNEIAKKGKNVVMTSKTHYFASLLLLLPYLEELKKSSSAGGKSGTFKSFALSCTVLTYLVSFGAGGEILPVLLIRIEEF